MRRTLTLSLLSASVCACAVDGNFETSGTEALGQVTDAGAIPSDPSKRFSFFMTSLRAMQEHSRSQNGFGGDLRFGETGDNAGLRGADKLCTTIAEEAMPGSGAKGWRAFLSTTKGGPGGGPVHAIDRIGNGPWYDRVGRLVARDKTDVAQVRPRNADPQILNDVPNEDGVPNKSPDGVPVDNHHVLTGSDGMGRLFRNDQRVTCNDWTSSARDVADSPRVGLSWPRTAADLPFPFPFPFGGDGGLPPFPGGGAANHWISAMHESGCAPGVALVNALLPDERNPTVGSGGGYGAIYCFALRP